MSSLIYEPNLVKYCSKLRIPQLGFFHIQKLLHLELEIKVKQNKWSTLLSVEKEDENSIGMCVCSDTCS